MKCPKCGSESVREESWEAYIFELDRYRHRIIVRCESCGNVARHESYDLDEARVMARRKFNLNAEVEG